MLSTQAFEVPKARIEAALTSGRKRTAVAGAETEAVGTGDEKQTSARAVDMTRADPPEARLASVALAMTV